VVGFLRLPRPAPGILKRGDLGLQVHAAFVVEEYVVRALRVKGWVQVNQTNALVEDVLAQDSQIQGAEKGELPIANLRKM
jgi:hypothetical protein